MNQSRLDSLIEALVNVAFGAGISFISQLLLFPLVGVQATLKQNLWLMFWFTIVSILRSYYIRRKFNNFKGISTWLQSTQLWQNAARGTAYFRNMLGSRKR